MEIVEPKVELIKQNDIKEHVCRCARVCYGKESGNDDALYNNLINSHHWSMFRHATYYAIVPIKNTEFNFIHQIYDSPYQTIGIDVYKDRDSYYVVYNGNFALDYPHTHEFLTSYLVSPKGFSNFSEIAWLMMRYTFKITTQLSTSRELNRKSPNNISEQSTRYVDLKNGAICRPHWMDKEIVESFNNFNYWDDENYKDLSKPTSCYLNSVEYAFEIYNILLKYGMKKEDARGVLPLDIATTVVYTYSVEEWKNIIKLRTDKRAHPNCQIIANMVKKELEELGYDFK